MKIEHFCGKYFSSYLLIICVLLSSFYLFSCDENPESAETGIQYSWQSADPSTLGLDQEKLNAALTEAGNKSFINSVLVIRHGKIAAERYYNGFDQNKPQNVRSVSKSFLSAMIGIAVSDSLLSIDQKVMDFYPEYKNYVQDPRINNITIKELLNMKGGFDTDENIYNYVTNSSNWIRTTLSLQLLSDPGTEFHYSTPAVHLLSGILTKASGMSTREFAEEYLLEPMGISVGEWQQDPQGIYFGGNNMFFTTRNMAVLGLMYMNGGKLDGKQIVPSDWVAKSISPLWSLPGSSWGELTNYGYGYFWWTGTLKNYKVFFALGHGGQYVMCFPSLDMIVTATSDSYIDFAPADEQERSVLSIIADYILPAVKD